MQSSSVFGISRERFPLDVMPEDIRPLQCFYSVQPVGNELTIYRDQVMKPRILLLFAALTIVSAATAWRIANPLKTKPFDPTSLIVKQAPEFRLLDQNDRQTILKSYLHRHPILIYFFDGSNGPDADPVLQQLVKMSESLLSGGYRIFAVSSPLGPDHKPETMKYPFPILRDTLAGQTGSCCNLWGRLKDGESTPPVRVRPALFLIEQNGMVRWNDKHPRAIEDPEKFLTDLL
jgi:peroxiredoxin